MGTVVKVCSRLERHKRTMGIAETAETAETAGTSRTYATERMWFDKGIN